ncbi:MAG: hypothetical protein E6767_10440 [Dysgonomonas sp.]|nr:hypothetical protein [Dysgonomonas sp.]
MEKNNIQDDKIRNLLAGTKVQASENLKYRIMQQIETEKALAPKKSTSSRLILGNMFTIFGIMYGLIAAIGFYIYSTSGTQGLMSLSFFVPVILIGAVCSVFWMITMYDDRRRSKAGEGSHTEK